jgi:hypothetical protein
MIVAAFRVAWPFIRALWPLWLLLGLVGAFYGHGRYERHLGDVQGSARVQAAWDKERKVMQAALDAEKLRQQQVVTRTVIEYRDRIQIVKEQADAIVKEVPILIPAGGCQLSGAFRVLHDAAAGGELPENPGRAAAAADPVEIAAAAETVFANYAACRADQTRLSELQKLVKGFQPADQGATP